MAVVSPLRTWGFGWLLLLFGSLGFAAAWILLGTVRNSYCSWMAVLAAADAALLLRLARVPAGAGRAIAAALATLLAAAVAYWGIIATWVGSPLGLLPWESARRLGLEHAALMLELGIDRVDIAWLGAAVVVALVTSR
ncbi:hypothetical protein ACYX7E_06985 [Luteimonas sp. RIT-PG2_3]